MYLTVMLVLCMSDCGQVCVKQRFRLLKHCTKNINKVQSMLCGDEWQAYVYAFQNKASLALWNSTYSA